MAIDIGAQLIPWRFTTPLHKNDGARRLLIKSMTFPDGGTYQFWRDLLYSSNTIDRVIGMRVTNLSQTPITGLTITELRSGTIFNLTGYTTISAAYFNMETGTDGADFVASVQAGAYPIALQIAAFNFEIGQTIMGH